MKAYMSSMHVLSMALSTLGLPFLGLSLCAGGGL